MLKFLAKPDLTQRDIAPDIVKEYQTAARYGLKTWWQRAMTSNGVSLAEPTARQGFAIAGELDKREVAGVVVPASTERQGDNNLADLMRAAAERHLVESADLDKMQQDRKMAEGRARRRARPGLLSRLRAIVDEAHASRLSEERTQRIYDINASHLRDAAERRALHKAQQATLQGLRRDRMAEDAALNSEATPRDMTTRQQLINTQVLVTLSSHIARPFGAQAIGRLHLAAISQGLEPGHPLAKDIDPTFMTGDGKLQADARVLAFGLTVAQAKRETQQLQTIAETAPHAAQEQAKRVQSLLREGFSSEAGKLFNRNLPPIQQAIGTTIDTIADRPSPPTAQVIILRA